MLESVRSVAGIVLINKVNTIFVIGGVIMIFMLIIFLRY